MYLSDYPQGCLQKDKGNSIGFFSNFFANAGSRIKDDKEKQISKKYGLVCQCN